MKVLGYKHYYFLGIGGIGMSALARYFKHYGKKVSGYDRNRSELTIALEKEEIECHYQEDVANLKSIIFETGESDILVIYTPAIPKDNAELLFLQEQNIKLWKRSQVLGAITRDFKTIAIAGTHGKTTTTTLVAHLLTNAGFNCFAFMGGISKNYNTNLLLGNAGSDAWVVVEADEYDRSFLTLHPDIALITSVDADHLDIYGDDKHVKEGYTLFASQLKENGVLVVKKNVDNELTLTGKRFIYSLNLDTDYCAQEINVVDGQFEYDVKTPRSTVRRVVLGLPGMHNIENSIAAVAIAQQAGVTEEAIAEGLRSFKGVKRRFDYRVRSKDIVYIDDYAHHPEELRAAITSVRTIYPGKKITGIFQPHLFSRTRDFVDGFAESLSMLDECLLLEIYPAREKPIEGVNSAWLLEKISCKRKKLLGKEELLKEIGNGSYEVLITMGAGDIDTLVGEIEVLIKDKIEKDKL